MRLILTKKHKTSTQTKTSIKKEKNGEISRRKLKNPHGYYNNAQTKSIQYNTNKMFMYINTNIQ